MSDIIVTLPYPPSTNRYWRTRVIGKGSKAFVSTYVSSEAKEFKLRTAFALRQVGVREPFRGKVTVEYWLFPARPLDWKKRCRLDPYNWDMTVQCLDVDNPLKILLDALAPIAYLNDKQVRGQSGDIMLPDEHGARLVVQISERPVQKDLLG